ncbi:MAG TPA: C4-dicarboxylate ABC transporter permease, partial [Syntrophaceae bacterium]|nr:C4-dicarboxylate ABC transporter permease [Syntrophaceae bacterium]
GPRGPKSTWREKFKSLSGLVETLLLFVLVMGGLFAGFFTPTEAAGVGAFGTIIIAFLGRHLTWKGFRNALYDTTRITCMIFVVVAGATVFGHFLAVTRIPADIGIFVSGLQFHPMIIMGLIILIYLLLGCLMDSLAMIMLTIPIFYPVILTLGFDPIWFGVIIVVVSGMGVITPPVGINAYVVAGVARDVPLHVIFKGSLHMLYAMIALAVLLVIFPKIVTFLPQMLR